MIETNGQSNFSRSLWLTLGTLAILFITFGLYSYSEYQVKNARAMQLTSVILADELRQTSDDLTRMSRLYVSTGNPQYKQYYQEILDIRDGKAPRPVSSDEIYWDLVLANNYRPRPSGPASSLLTLMRQAHFSALEFQKLSQSKSNSDKLTHIEMTAMKLIEPPFIMSDDNRIKAIQIISDLTYLQAKRDIMLPIADFNTMVKQRTQKVVRFHEHISTVLFVILILLGILLIYRLWASYRALISTLGCSADKLRAAIAQIGNGNFSTNLSVPRGKKNSVLSWLTEMQGHLLHSESERKLMADKMRELAYYDSLTDLPNRRMLNDRLKQAFSFSKRLGWCGALMFIDLDNFKPLNDLYGHATGDLLLIEVAQRLTHCLRETDTIARFGGDEFVVLLTSLDKDKVTARDHAMLVAEKIRVTLAASYLLILPGGGKMKPITHCCSASIGIVMFFNHENSQEELLKLADMAMYQAKLAGRNQIRMSEKP